MWVQTGETETFDNKANTFWNFPEKFREKKAFQSVNEVVWLDVLWCVINEDIEETYRHGFVFISQERNFLTFPGLRMYSSLGTANSYLPGTSSGHLLETCIGGTESISTIKVKTYKHSLESEQFYTWIISENDEKMMIWKIEMLHLILSGYVIKSVQRNSLETLDKKELTIASAHTSNGITTMFNAKSTSLSLNDKVY